MYCNSKDIYVDMYGELYEDNCKRRINGQTLTEYSGSAIKKGDVRSRIMMGRSRIMLEIMFVCITKCPKDKLSFTNLDLCYSNRTGTYKCSGDMMYGKKN